MLGILESRYMFEKLFRENYSRLYYHALSFLNDEEAARDAVNDVFERVWIHFEKIDREGSLVPLLFTFVRNHCVDQIRHRKAEDRFLREAVLKGEFADEEYMEYENLIERVRCSILKLPGQTQIVFKKCFLDGKKYQEVADELGISINTVKTHINKALRILREEFSDTSITLVIFLIKSTKKV